MTVIVRLICGLHPDSIRWQVPWASNRPHLALCCHLWFTYLGQCLCRRGVTMFRLREAAPYSSRFSNSMFQSDWFHVQTLSGYFKVVLIALQKTFSNVHWSQCCIEWNNPAGCPFDVFQGSENLADPTWNSLNSQPLAPISNFSGVIFYIGRKKGKRRYSGGSSHVCLWTVSSYTHTQKKKKTWELGKQELGERLQNLRSVLNTQLLSASEFS